MRAKTFATLSSPGGTIAPPIMERSPPAARHLPAVRRGAGGHQEAAIRFRWAPAGLQSEADRDGSGAVSVAALASARQRAAPPVVPVRERAPEARRLPHRLRG